MARTILERATTASVLADPGTRFVESGDTLAKYGDLMIKQTAQILELLKLKEKNSKNDDDLDEDDLEQISAGISLAK